jgi:excisionase family DNA binding protein
MASQDPDSWVTQAEAARLRGVTRQAIHRLVERGKLNTVRVGGARLLVREEVVNYEPGTAGRPATNDRSHEGSE